MKQQDLDSVHELDAGWDDEDLEDSSPGVGASSASSDKPQSLASSSPEADELDAGWDDTEDEAPDHSKQAPSGAALKGIPATARSVRSVASGQISGPQTPASARASFKKAHRELAKKHEEHARRRKKLKKAERKAQRQQAAREARAERDRKARAEREQKARAEAERKARRQQAAEAQARLAGGGRRAPTARTGKQSGRVLQAKGEARQRSADALPRASRRPKRERQKKLRAKERARRQRTRLWLLVAAGVLVVLGVAWLLGQR